MPWRGTVRSNYPLMPSDSQAAPLFFNRESERVMEEWRDIPGYEGFYQASSEGRVRSVDRVLVRSNGRSHTVRGKVLRPGISSRYSMVVLRNEDGVNGKTVHSIVAETFIGPRPDGMVIDHKDENTENNRPNNLEYVTQRENVRRFHKNKGTECIGVYWYKRKSKWMARIYRKEGSVFLGYFKDKQDAIRAVQMKEVEIGVR